MKGQRPQGARPGGQRGRHGVPLGADRQPVGRVLNVAAHGYPFLGEDGRPDAESGVGGVSRLGRLASGFDEVIPWLDGEGWGGRG